MRTVILIFLMNISLNSYSCFGEGNEPIVLFKCFYKVINHGYFSFAEIKENEIILINYSYSIDLKRGKKDISLINKDTLNRKDLRRFKAYQTEEQWSKEQASSYREKYFKILDANFLNMSNKEKLFLMNRLSDLNQKGK